MPTPIYRKKIGLRIDGNTEFDSFEFLYKALQKFGLLWLQFNRPIKEKGKERQYHSHWLTKKRLNKALKNKEIHPSRKSPSTGSRGTNCEFKRDGKEHPSEKWIVVYKEANHNHVLSDEAINYPTHRSKYSMSMMRREGSSHVFSLEIIINHDVRIWYTTLMSRVSISNLIHGF